MSADGEELAGWLHVAAGHPCEWAGCDRPNGRRLPYAGASGQGLRALCLKRATHRIVQHVYRDPPKEREGFYLCLEHAIKVEEAWATSDIGGRQWVDL